MKKPIKKPVKKQTPVKKPTEVVSKKASKPIIPVFFSCDDNYFPILHVALRSLIDKASKDNFYKIHILYDTLAEESIKSLDIFNSENVEIILANVTSFMEERAKKMHAKYYALAIYYRVFIPRMFPEYDKSLYLDVDICLNADVAELYNYELKDTEYVGAITCETVDCVPCFFQYAHKALGLKLPYYFNSGILLFNSKIWRELKLEDKFFDVLQKAKLEICPDQDYFNIVCYGHTKWLPKVWNKIPAKNPSLSTGDANDVKLEDVKLVHYNLALKPWRYDNIMYEELFWEYAKDSMFYDKIMKDKAKVFSTAKKKDKIRYKALTKMAWQYAKAPETVMRKLNDGKSPDRLLVLERIAEKEKAGEFNVDVEADPPFKPLDSKKIDYLNKKFWTRVKRDIAYFFGKRYFEGLMKNKQVVFAGTKGDENLKHFKGGALVTCNHVHHFDNYAVLLALKPHFPEMGNAMFKIVREGNYSFPGMLGFMIRNCDTLPVNEYERKNLKLTVETIKAVQILLEIGAFKLAAKSNAPIIPCFLTLKDSEIIGSDGFPVQEFTLRILPMIFPDPKLDAQENAGIMLKRNAELWKETYEQTYGIPLTYTTESK
jgi:lipopolysaccharide biosynthesis glycosyltransferase